MTIKSYDHGCVFVVLKLHLRFRCTDIVKPLDLDTFTQFPLCSKDLYDILQVPKGASESLIKRSYRKLALQYHPVRVNLQFIIFSICSKGFFNLAFHTMHYSSCISVVEFPVCNFSF